MRPSDSLRVLVCAIAAGLGGACEQPLPGGDLGAGPGAVDAGPPTPPVAAGCRAFRSAPGVTTVSGAMRSLPRAGGGAILVVDDAVVAGADVPSLALAVDASASLDDCLASATVEGGGSVLDPPGLTPLSGVVVGTTSMLYYADPAGSVGVAAQDPTDGRFRPTGSLLWTSDRPVFGTAAVTDGTYVFAVGCRGARFLDADCFVARASPSSIGDPSAYGYYVGSDRWSPRADDAWPVTPGSTSVDVAPLPGSRWLMAYVPPLGDTLTVRSGLSPAGPWSGPIPVARCDLADADMFCSGVHLHPALAAPSGTIVLSYAPASLSPDAAARRAAEPDKWWPRLAVLALPPLP